MNNKKRKRKKKQWCTILMPISSEKATPGARGSLPRALDQGKLDVEASVRSPSRPRPFSNAIWQGVKKSYARGASRKWRFRTCAALPDGQLGGRGAAASERRLVITNRRDIDWPNNLELFVSATLIPTGRCAHRPTSTADRLNDGFRICKQSVDNSSKLSPHSSSHASHARPQLTNGSRGTGGIACGSCILWETNVHIRWNTWQINLCQRLCQTLMQRSNLLKTKSSFLAHNTFKFD